MGVVRPTTVASWDTVSASRNNKLYVVEQVGQVYHARVAVVPSGAYDSETLRVVVDNALNGAGKNITGNYNVQRSSSAGTVQHGEPGGCVSLLYNHYIRGWRMFIRHGRLVEEEHPYMD